ncbi:MAG: nucleotidyl transferase AbiEii/AbiGii toxin family protein [Balneolaceae bacterium]|nr:nucleotidyl transferase AbiEii/AbiGii toxin family protein [Balneolaceae bacterium]
MIDQNQLTTEWVRQVSKKHKADPLLVEKVIRALMLLEGLVKHELDFIFKGGTSLMLHFDSTKRLSIDIDIILPDKEVELDDVLDSVVKGQGFSRWELQERNARSSIEKAHYKLHYEPLHRTGKEEEYVLLDILFEQDHYTTLTKLPIQSHFVPQKGEPLMAEVPSIEDLLGDKLTAFAPNTTGIPYFKGDDSMSMEIIKQLYDIGNLFDATEDLQTVKGTFQRFADAELVYRETDGLTAGDVLEDIYQTSLSIATRGKDGKANFDELQSGIKRLQSFIFSERYHLEKAISHATKAAYVASLIKQDTDRFERFDPAEKMGDWQIEHPMNTRVNKLKKSNPEAFFYWYKIFELTKE